jgi:hypothetical protein
MLKISLLTVSAGITLTLASYAGAQTSPGLPPGLSDELQVLAPSGAPLFDNFIPELPPTAGDEKPLVFSPGNPGPSALAFDPAAAILQGANYTLMLDPVGEPLDPGETQIPITIPGTTQTYFLSDAVVSTLNIPATQPPQVALFSDPSQFLQEIASVIPSAANNPPKFIFETGQLQFIDVGSSAQQFGVGAVFVASDVEVPEPATMSLLGIASAGLLVRRRRMV